MNPAHVEHSGAAFVVADETGHRAAAAELGGGFGEFGGKIAEENIVELHSARNLVDQRHLNAELGIERLDRLR